MDSERLDKLFDFFREIDKEKLITRQTYITDCARKETDAEHAWHAALMCIMLAGYSNDEIDVLKTVTMLLIHDIVEIDAGDTYAYDSEGQKTQREREEKAADRIFGMLPGEDGNFLRTLWEEFEQSETAEAKFARVMDHLQPLMLNDLTGGRAWREHGVHLSQVLKRNEKTCEGSEKLWEYAYENLIRKKKKKGNLKTDQINEQ